MRYFAECGSFFREFRRRTAETGSVLPSSRFLARALVSELRKPRPAGAILEVGPGTGAVTRRLAEKLIPGDQLDVVEINEQFVKLLGRRFEREWIFRFHQEQIRLIHSGVDEIKGEGLYDYIISGLPLNNFPPHSVRAVFQTFDRLLKPGGTLSYFEYFWVRQLKTPFVDDQERRRLYKVGRIVGRNIRKYQVRRQQVLMNVPPAIVRHLRLKPQTEDQAVRKVPTARF
jgi:phosphatidylethanolamine/phosphatidyl-N-methylethanolamine N-methyltransferase